MTDSRAGATFNRCAFGSLWSVRY